MFLFTSLSSLRGVGQGWWRVGVIKKGQESRG